MLYLNALLSAAFVAFFSWEETQWLPVNEPWHILAAGLGGLGALLLLLNTLRPLFIRSGR
ncbi:hypothetical protein K7W42_10955 [Deinococcus sp. HMF7604]|uniref:hypothetical protein n=1 Tax=Deinococcus betulae TaxID=2873312 RepID=UPI001CCBD0A6|nr:hypothetical protein [Deinococcus betulae]MBZ9751382.1 hypothetical protein [Deinococcus betulae]